MSEAGMLAAPLMQATHLAPALSGAAEGTCPFCLLRSDGLKLSLRPLPLNVHIYACLSACVCCWPAATSGKGQEGQG